MRAHTPSNSGSTFIAALLLAGAVIEPAMAQTSPDQAPVTLDFLRESVDGNQKLKSIARDAIMVLEVGGAVSVLLLGVSTLLASMRALTALISATPQPRQKSVQPDGNSFWQSSGPPVSASVSTTILWREALSSWPRLSSSRRLRSSNRLRAGDRGHRQAECPWPCQDSHRTSCPILPAFPSRLRPYS